MAKINTILVILTIIYITTSLNYEERDISTGVIFVRQDPTRVSYSSYTMVYHMDLTEFKNMTNMVLDLITRTNELCGYVEEKKSCELVMEYLHIQLIYMKEDENDIYAYQQSSKPKRAIEWLGGGFKWAFGLLDADAARNIDAKIESNIANTSRINHIVDEQLLIIKEQIKLNNSSYNSFQSQISALEKGLDMYRGLTAQHLKASNIQTKVHDTIRSWL